MGSLLIKPFSCTHIPKLPLTSKINMKAFTTLATLLGATYASPIQQIQYGSTGLQHSGISMMTNQKMHPMSTQHMTMTTKPMMKVVAEMPQPVVNPNQYRLKDNLGNYAFGYSTQNSEMAEEGNAQLKKGHFANIMADGKMRRVDYIADNQGFHILRDTADNTGKYIKREAETSVEPDLIRTRISSYMDSSSLRNDNNLHQMSNNQMGRDMSTMNMMDNDMSSMNNMMGRDMSSMNILGRDISSMNMMGHGITSMNKMGRDMSSRYNMMGQDISSINKMSQGLNNMMGHDISSMNMMGRDMSSMNMMGRDMSSRNNMMGRDMSSRNNMMNLDNMMGHDMSSRNNMMGPDMSSRNNMVGHDMSTNQMSQEMSSNLMGRDMYSNQMLSSNTMGLDMNRMAPPNTMSQRMQIETMPSQSLNRFF